MKKWLRYLLGIIGIVVIAFFVYRIFPRAVNQSYKGVEYQLGAGHNGVTPVHITMNGTLYHSLLGKATFVGKVDLKGAHYLNKGKNETIKIHFDKNGRGMLNYAYFKDGKGVVYSDGVLFANKNFSQVTIEELRENGSGGHGWNGGNGWMVTGPATSRSQALRISNALMKHS